MMLLDQGLVWLTLIGAGLGSWSVYWARNSASPLRAWWGRCIFLTICVVLGIFALLAACCQAQALTVLGLCLGLLIVAMSWDGHPGLAHSAPAAVDD
jgi:hypothetical protein